MSGEKHVAIVTGANGAIGSAIAGALAARPGWEVHLLCRSAEKAERAASGIRDATGGASVHTAIADLGMKRDIDAFVKTWRGPLDVLLNNAAIAPRRREETEEGVERQFAVNVLSYLRLAEGLREALAASGAGRVVNVASYWAGGLDLDDLEFKRRPYDNDAAYRQSKQANRMLSAALADRFKDGGITVNACHPGDVNSSLSNDLGFGGHETPAQGATTPVWLATEPIGRERNGAYFEHCADTLCHFSADTAAVARLYEICAAY